MSTRTLVPEKVSVYEMLEVYERYLESFRENQGMDSAEVAFKRIFGTAVARVLSESGELDTDAEIQGLIALAHVVFEESDRVTLIVTECYASAGVGKVLGQKMVSSRIH